MTTKTFKDIRENATFSLDNKLWLKINPEYTPSGRQNAKDQMTGQYITILPETKVKLITTRFDYA